MLKSGRMLAITKRSSLRSFLLLLSLLSQNISFSNIEDWQVLKLTGTERIPARDLYGVTTTIVMALSPRPHTRRQHWLQGKGRLVVTLVSLRDQYGGLRPLLRNDNVWIMVRVHCSFLVSDSTISSPSPNLTGKTLSQCWASLSRWVKQIAFV